MGVLVLLAMAFLAADGARTQRNDWVPYKDEIFIKAFTTLSTYEEAQSFCALQGDNENSMPSLVIVKELDLQELLTTYTQDIVDNIWLGAKYDNDSSKFLWEDGESLAYTNWQDGYPRNITNGDACLEFIPLDVKRPRKAQGKWTHVTCRKRNLVMCQKRIPWTLEDAVKEIKYVRKTLEALQEEHATLQQKHEELSTKVVPVGSIYIEYYNQPSPQELWSSLKWLNVTDTYAGLFFRAASGEAAGWGSVQAECSPRLTHVDHSTLPSAPAEMFAFNYTGPTHWSGHVNLGRTYSATTSNWNGLDFLVSGCGAQNDVRPRNQAIRLWKRIL